MSSIVLYHSTAHYRTQRAYHVTLDLKDLSKFGSAKTEAPVNFLLNILKTLCCYLNHLNGPFVDN